jgi:hypothetical protein
MRHASDLHQAYESNYDSARMTSDTHMGRNQVTFGSMKIFADAAITAVMEQ